MAWTLGTRTINVLSLLAPSTVTATETTSSIDLLGTADNTHEIRVHINVGAVSGTAPTLTVQISESPDNSTFTPNANAITGTISAIGTTDLYYRAVNPQARYLKAILTVGGTTPSYTLAIDLYAVQHSV